MFSKTNYFVLLNLLFFLNTVKSFYLQFKVVDVKNDGFKNINISCKNNQINENLNIPFLYNSVATHIYKGNGCKDNKYVLNILLKESNIQSAVEIICKYEGKPKKQTILFTIKVDNQNNCFYSFLPTEPTIQKTDQEFQNLLINGYNNIEKLIRLIDEKLHYFKNYFNPNTRNNFNFKSWQLIIQEQIIEYLFLFLFNNIQNKQIENLFKRIKEVEQFIQIELNKQSSNQQGLRYQIGKIKSLNDFTDFHVIIINFLKIHSALQYSNNFHSINYELTPEEEINRQQLYYSLFHNAEEEIASSSLPQRN